MILKSLLAQTILWFAEKILMNLSAPNIGHACNFSPKRYDLNLLEWAFKTSVDVMLAKK